MDILYWDPYDIPQDIVSKFGATKLDTIEDICKESDFVSVNCPATKETFHLMNKERFEMMKPTAFVINTARGDIIDSRGNVSVPREKISKEFYKDTVPGADKEEISINEESPPAPKKTIKKKTEPTEPQEVSREMRERNDGTMYYEVEYDDGSMEEINV